MLLRPFCVHDRSLSFRSDHVNACSFSTPPLQWRSQWILDDKNSGCQFSPAEGCMAARTLSSVASFRIRARVMI